MNHVLVEVERNLSNVTGDNMSSFRIYFGIFLVFNLVFNWKIFPVGNPLGLKRFQDDKKVVC